MQRSLLALAIMMAGAASATPFTGNDTRSNAMGNTGVASAESFAASQFNPALLSAYNDNVDFGLQLPSLLLAIDDGYGFLKAANVADEFEGTNTEAIVQQVNTLDAAVTRLQTAADALNDGTDSTEIAEFDAANQALSTKITIIQDEMIKLNLAVSNTSDSLSTLEDRPLSLLGSIGTAIAIPHSGLGLALHLNTSANLGMRAEIAQDDLTLLTNIVSDTVGFTAEAQQMTQLSADLSAAVNTFNQFDTSQNPCVGAASDPYLIAFNNMVIAQAALAAESSGTPQTPTVCPGSSGFPVAGPTQNPIGSTNLADFNSANGVYVSGELQASAIDGLGEASSITILGANIMELGISAAREVTYFGQTFSVGVTPKLQALQIFEDTIDLNNADILDPSNFRQNLTTAVSGNLDIGLAKNWYNILHGQVRAGLVVKDLIPQTFESSSGRELHLAPKARFGIAHDTRFSTLAFDLDLTENEPLGYGVTSRYIGLGAELDAFNWVKVRAGYRNNLSVDDSHVVTTGLGFTPFGVGLDVTTWFSPAPLDEWEDIVRDAGIAAQLSVNW